jgi:hypothetical protein
MQRLGYANRGSFWQFVHLNGVPHIRLNSRTCKFDEAALERWIEQHSVYSRSGGAA